ncbi:hypothetical protein [Stenotrophomonas sp. AS1]|uniref:hypothetical protein n=1 Tax=Stenotrophomonas sp. AS1 TaxID=3029188 RepID=UPI003B75EFE2
MNKIISKFRRMFSKPPAQPLTEQQLRDELEQRLEAHSRTQANDGRNPWEKAINASFLDIYVSVGAADIGYIKEISHDQSKSRLWVGHFRTNKDRSGKGFGTAMLHGVGRVAKEYLKCTEIVIRSKGKHRDEVDKFMLGKGAIPLHPVSNSGKEWLWKIP